MVGADLSADPIWAHCMHSGPLLCAYALVASCPRQECALFVGSVTLPADKMNIGRGLVVYVGIAGKISMMCECWLLRLLLLFESLSLAIPCGMLVRLR
jgi:hypothetical protein